MDYPNTAKILDINLEYFMLPVITKPTRTTHCSASLRDNVYISKNLQMDYKSLILVESLSDHLPCLVSLNQCLKLCHNSNTHTCTHINREKQKIINDIHLKIVR